MRLKACLPSSPDTGSNAASFTSIVELQAAISRFIAEANDMPKPFVWTKSADDILAAVQRGRQALEAIHSHVRLCQMQARKFAAFFQALVFGLYQARQEARPS